MTGGAALTSVDLKGVVRALEVIQAGSHHTNVTFSQKTLGSDRRNDLNFRVGYRLLLGTVWVPTLKQEFSISQNRVFIEGQGKKWEWQLPRSVVWRFLICQSKIWTAWAETPDPSFEKKWPNAFITGVGIGWPVPWNNQTRQRKKKLDSVKLLSR